MRSSVPNNSMCLCSSQTVMPQGENYSPDHLYVCVGYAVVNVPTNCYYI